MFFKITTGRFSFFSTSSYHSNSSSSSYSLHFSSNFSTRVVSPSISIEGTSYHFFRTCSYFNSNLIGTNTLFLNQLEDKKKRSKRRMTTSKDSSKINVLELLSACIESATKASEIIRQVWSSGNLNVQNKGINDPFTEADVKAQQTIMSMLRVKWPQITIVGEEDCSQAPIQDFELNFDRLKEFNDKVSPEFKSVDLKDIVIFVDPLDATKEYTKGILEAVTTLIGISYKGEPIGGVVYQPFVHSPQDTEKKGTCIYGLQSIGVFGIEKKERNDGKVVLITTASHFSAEVQEAIALIKPDQVIRAGGSGNKVVQILLGVADVYVYPTPGTKKWDTCAPEALLRILGGTLTDTTGTPYSYFANSSHSNSKGIVCSLIGQADYIRFLNPHSKI